MERLNSIRFVLVAVTILLLGSAGMVAAETTFENASGAVVVGVRCATPIPSMEETEANARAISNWLRLGEYTPQKAVVTIPIAIHVVAHDDGYGDVPDTQIDAQMQVLNDAYAGTCQKEP